MDRKQLVYLLKEFGKIIGIEELGLDEEDGCVIGFDDAIIINLQFVEDNNSLALFANLGKVKEENKSEQFAEMLEANFYERARGGPSLGYNRETRSALLIYQTELNFMDIVGFEKLMEKFINIAEAWMKRLSETHQEKTDKDIKTDQPLPPNLMA